MVARVYTETTCLEIREFNAAGSVDKLPRRPNRHVTTSQQDRYIMVTYLWIET